ncbi:MAG: T9SS type A sorting domain-containing protein [Crocinitomicaceae bacterium]|nr:T9SS type A sorting domain-containing protein [Crocinitomicaceae bacterium]
MYKSSLLFLAVALSINSVAYKNFNHHHSSNDHGNDGRAANCAPANERLFMQYNNVRAIIETGGSLWQDRLTGANGSASYEVPKGSNKHVLYSGALWMAGEDINGQLKIAAHMFRQGNDFWAGPLGDLIEGTGNYNPFEIQNAEKTLYRDYGAAEIIPSECNKYDQFFTIRRSEVIQFVNWWNCENDPNVDPAKCDGVEKPNDDIMNRIINWPAHGDVTLGQDFYLAPFYDNKDYDGNQADIYDPLNDGDYPWYDLEMEIQCRNDRRVTLYGDETHWWVFNDKGNIHTETGGDPIGMEVRAQAFSFATNDAINDMTFYNYELINRGTQTLYNTYFGQWVDSDIGKADNDYVGCDVSRGLGYGYNAQTFDAGQSGQEPYGLSPPAIGVDFFEGPYKDNDQKDNPLTTNIPEAIAEEGIPYEGLGIGYGDGIIDNERLGMSKFVYFNNESGDKGDPQTAVEYYQYMRGMWKNGDPFTYGDDGFGGSLITSYCFPGDSDPYGWGTGGVQGPEWSEVTEQNPVNQDKRFLQSAGPFTLKPGAVNNITVGVVYGRNTAESDLESSVRTMKAADTKAQALFDNCFELVNPPPAPILTIQEMENELILYLESGPNFDEEEWFAEDVININTPDSLKDQGIYYDDTFRFEGYQIYQLVDKDASVSEIDDIEKARLVAQCDIKNGVSKLVNYTYDEQLGITIPAVMVDGADEGIEHSFRVTEDLFATGDRKLINHKKYYYIAVAYAYNNFKNYDPNDPDALDGQKIPYLRSRQAAVGGEIESVLGIPHDPTPEAHGTTFTTSYGYQPPITQIEGIGNGGAFLRLDSSSIDYIVANWDMNHPTYQSGYGPIGVKVIDPLNLAAGTYTLRFDQNPSDINEASWSIERLYNSQTEVISSDYVVGVKNEQLILDWGISVTINQQYYEGTGNCTDKYTDPIAATLTYADSSKSWLSGVSDDDQYYPTNWIRSGSTNENEGDNPGGCNPYNWIYNQCAYNDYSLDDEQEYEKLLDGTVAPFNRVGAGVYGMPFGWPGDSATMNNNQGWFTLAGTALKKACFTKLHDVDIIITSDKSKWTRCPVIEINDNESQTEHGDDILGMRSDLSVDKSGLSVGDPGYNPAEGDLIQSTGMGWFPGFAIDVTTGQRLNMCFSENSWLRGENGDDMIWNPTANFADQVDNPLFGGMHYVYVFGEDLNDSGSPAYDQGQWLSEMFDVTAANRKSNFYEAWRSCMWVWEPMLKKNARLLATDAELNLRVNMPYQDRLVNGENNARPMYQFTISEPTKLAQGDALESVLDNINVVPNPYYGYSAYETSKLDNRIKFTNLPEVCEITIFNMQGALVRNFKKNDPLTSLDWNLQNHQGVPIAGGLYVIHIKLPPNEYNGLEQRERIIKWYGAIRPPDLDNL